MKRMKTAIALVMALVIAVAFHAASPIDYVWAGNGNTKELKLADPFHGQEGTLMIKNLRNDKTYVYNPARSETPFTPESSFKVANALIGLHYEVVSDEYDIKRWDGTEREFEAWNRDHALGSAMRDSAIWYYQELAKDIGEQRMREGLAKLQYGNMDISGGIDRFWLDSTLKITAEEQLAFMEQLAEETLPFDEQEVKTVKRMMLNVDQDDYDLYGKTGTRLADYGLGWYVGFVETDKDTWVFAANVAGSGNVAKAAVIDTIQYLNIIDSMPAQP